MKKAPAIIFLACISLFCACNKSPFSNGEVFEYERTIDQPFQIVELNDNLDVTLQHCDDSHPAGTIFIRIGENLIDKIETEIEERTINEVDTISLAMKALVIRDNNTLGFLRPYDYTREMTIYYDSLLQITLNSNANCIQTDTLRGYSIVTQFTNDDTTWYEPSSTLILQVDGGSGNFHVLTNCYKLITKYIHGTSNIDVKGKATLAFTFADYDCHGIIDNKFLDTHIHYITTNGTNIIKSKSYHLLDIKNKNIGKVHYLKYWTTEEELVWNDSLHQIDTVVEKVLCPKAIRYNSEYINNWNYNNEIPGLVKELE